MQLTLTIIALILSILFLGKKYIYNKSKKGCDTGDCGCK